MNSKGTHIRLTKRRWDMEGRGEEVEENGERRRRWGEREMLSRPRKRPR